FHRFQSVPGAKPGSTGLGLAISKRLVEAHGGQVSARSEVGRGAKITFQLTIVHEDANYGETPRADLALGHGATYLVFSTCASRVSKDFIRRSEGKANGANNKGVAVCEHPRPTRFDDE